MLSVCIFRHGGAGPEVQESSWCGLFVFIGTVDEEDFMRGVEMCYPGRLGRPGGLDFRHPEPTDGQIQVAHKGRTWFELTMRGITAHRQQSVEGR
ncbi:MAG: hypothetical protein ACLR0U_32465 [Enterocloster clostridioformis]